MTHWAHDGRRWRPRMRATDGRIGYGGLVAATRRRQGTGTTPLGTFGLPSAFGTHRRRGRWDLGYRNQRRAGFRWWLPSSDPDSPERLTDYGRRALVIAIGR